MKFFQLFRFRYVRAILVTLNREAALDSFRNVLAVFGAASVLGILAVVKWFFILPAFSFLVIVWYMDYLRHDFHPMQTALDHAGAAYEEIKEQV